MLASITPLGERGRQSRWGVTATMYVIGSLIGGAAIGAAAGLLGWVALGGIGSLGAVGLHARVAALAATLAVGMAWELARGGVPGPRRQVDERWLDRYRGWVYGLGYGAQLGAGLTTVVVSSSVYIVPVAAALTARPPIGGVIGAVSGGLRGVSVLVARPVVSPQRLVAFHARMHLIERPVRLATLASQLALACVAAIAAGV
jgi:phage-related tail protein